MKSLSPRPLPRIVLEPVKLLTSAAELALLREAYSRRGAPAIRRKLANALARRADWDAVIALLNGTPDLSTDECLLLAAAWLDLPSSDRCTQAAQLIEQVLVAGEAYLISKALVLRATIETRNGNVAAARVSLKEALEIDPGNRAACMRLGSIALRAGDVDAALAMVDTLVRRGIGHAYLPAIRALAQGLSGDIAGARATIAADQLGFSAFVAPPPGWSDGAEFNAALARELKAHTDLRRQRYGASPVESWGIDKPLTPDAPLLHQLMKQIAAEIETRLAALANADHSWLDHRPATATLHCSCVMTEAEDFEDWHVHPTGWLNGVYYVEIPEAVVNGSDSAGCIGFGLPESLAGSAAAAAYGVTTIRPSNGLMVAFPSHTYHRTFMHGCEGRRIAVTFELRSA